MKRLILGILSLLTLVGSILLTSCALLGRESSSVILSSQEQVEGRTQFESAVNEKINSILGSPLPELPLRLTCSLRDSDLLAPMPDAAGFCQTENVADLESVLNEAAALLEGQALLFSLDSPVMEGTSVSCYLDETLFTITWKQTVDGCVYTFLEAKLAHPSQFRRFLSDGRYGSSVLRTTSEMSQSVNAVAASAGDYYAYRDGGIVVYNGQVYRAEGRTLDTCFVDEAGDLIFSPAGSLCSREEIQDFVQERGIRFSLSFGPVMLEDGENVVPYDYNSGEINTPYPRAALCQLGSCHYLVVTANQEQGLYHVPSVHSFAGFLKEMGISRAYGLDGGQTATIAMNHQVINRVSYGSERKISDIIYFATAVPEEQADGA